jgi:hypothetical protein
VRLCAPVALIALAPSSYYEYLLKLWLLRRREGGAAEGAEAAATLPGVEAGARERAREQDALLAEYTAAVHHREQPGCIAHSESRVVSIRFGELPALLTRRAVAAIVTKTPSWPRSWANFSLYSRITTEMHGPTRICWASLRPCSPIGQVAAIEATMVSRVATTARAATGGGKLQLAWVRRASVAPRSPPSRRRAAHPIRNRFAGRIHACILFLLLDRQGDRAL